MIQIMIGLQQKLILFFSLGFSLYSQGSLAVEELTGAFGMRFGEYFNPEWANEVIHTDDGVPMFVVKPPKPYRSFTNKYFAYYVTISLKTRKIYAIMAAARMDSKSQCFNETDYIEELLNKKYLKPDEKNIASPVVNGYHLIQGKRSVIAKCKFEESITLFIIYRDQELTSQAIKERKELEAESRGDSGP